jgi:hypothetical protein
MDQAPIRDLSPRRYAVRVPKTEDVLAYARLMADDLEQDMKWIPGDDHGGWWQAKPARLLTTIMSRATAAQAFFQQYAGPDSAWTHRANEVYANRGNNQSLESGARALSDFLRAWCDQVEAGLIQIVGDQARAELQLVRTDLMSQVRDLLDDKKTHPAAAIVLCGAALQTALRALADARSITVDDPSLPRYTEALHHAGILTAQDVNELATCAGLHSAAAHGDFEALSHERAGLMQQMTLILLRRLADLQG